MTRFLSWTHNNRDTWHNKKYGDNNRKESKDYFSVGGKQIDGFLSQSHNNGNNGRETTCFLLDENNSIKSTNATE